MLFAFSNWLFTHIVSTLFFVFKVVLVLTKKLYFKLSTTRKSSIVVKIYVNFCDKVQVTQLSFLFFRCIRPTPQKSGTAASGGAVTTHASAVQNMLENGLTQFMQFRAQAAQAAHAVHASAAAAQAEHLLRNIGKRIS